MSLFKMSFLSLFVFPALAWAELGLAPASELLQRASQGRAELRDVILDMDNNISEMGSPQVFDSYFYILDNLKDLAIRFNLDEVYPDAIETLGAHMADSGIRWLDITEASTERILYFHRWMSMDGMIRYLNQVDSELAVIKSPAMLRVASENAENILTYIEDNYPYYFYLSSGYRRLVSGISMGFLRDPLATESDVIYWIGRLRSPDAYTDYLTGLSNDIYALRPVLRSRIHLFAQRILTLHATLESDRLKTPEAIYKTIGDVASDLLIKSLRMEEPLKSDEFQGLLSLLSVPQLRDLAGRWGNYQETPSDDFMEKYFATTKDFVVKLRAAQLYKEAQAVSSWASSVAVPAKIRAQELEGRYQLKDQSGTIWNVMILMVRENAAQAVLWQDGAGQGRIFQTLRWDFEKEAFMASERVLSVMDLAPPSLVQIRFVAGEVQFYDPFANAETQNMKGVLVEKFPDLLKEAKSSQMYEGFSQQRVVLKDGREILADLTVSSIDGHYVGRLIGAGLDVSYELGSSVNSGVLYLTTLPENGQVKDFSHLRKRGSTLFLVQW